MKRRTSLRCIALQRENGVLRGCGVSTRSPTFADVWRGYNGRWAERVYRGPRNEICVFHWAAARQVGREAIDGSMEREDVERAYMDSVAVETMRASVFHEKRP